MSVDRKVLVVDDDPDMVEQVSTILQSAGYQVITAGTQEEAEDVLLSVKPDIAIVDLMMEHTDSGFVLSRHLKQLHPGTPVIMLTAVTSATGVSFASDAPEAKAWVQVEKIMDKPVRKEQLLAEVRRLLRLDNADAGPAHP